MSKPEQPMGSMWAVMKAHVWDGIEVAGCPIHPPPSGPQRFIPLFETREQAVEWAGSDEHVAELVVGPVNESGAPSSALPPPRGF